MIRYTIYTEDKNIKFIEDYLSQIFSDVGFTIIKTKGYWKGKPEKALKIEVILQKPEDKAFKIICIVIKRVNKQESVLYTKENIEGVLV